MTTASVRDRGRAFVPAPKVRLPHLPPEVVRRSRLVARLDTADDPRRDGQGLVIVVTGAAGAGKTTLLADWLTTRGEHLGRACAWVSLGAEDDDVHALWSAILGALEATGAWHERGPLVDVAAPRGSLTTSTLAAVVAAVEGADRPLCLVLDDVHEIRDPAAVQSLDLLLRTLPDRLTVVLSGRFTPMLALARLRLADRVVDVEADALAFTRDEVDELVRAHGLELGATDTDRLLARTDGWAAGLKLAATSLRRAPDSTAFIDAFAGDNRAVADFLVGEVLAHLDPQTLDFLLAAATCEEVTDELARTLTGRVDAGELLARLSHENALIARVDEPSTRYRYHSMFREYLRAELRRRDPGAVPMLHGRAARWLAAHGSPVAALHHAVLSGDPALISAVVAEHGLSLVLDAPGRRVRHLLSEAGRLSPDATVHVVQVIAALEEGDVPQADALLASLAPEPPVGAPPEPWPRLHVLAQAQVTLRQGDPRGALALLETVAPGADGDVDLMLLATRAAARLQLGELDLGEIELRAAVRGAQHRGHDLLALTGLLHLSAAAGLRGDVPDMIGRGHAALDFATSHGWSGSVRTIEAHLVLGWAGYLSLDRLVAGDGAATAMALLDDSADPATVISARTLAAAVLAEQDGGTPRALAALRHLRESGHVGTGWQGLDAVAAQIEQRLALAAGHHAAADDVLRHVVARVGRTGETVVMQALQALDRGHPREAATLIEPVATGEVACAHPATSVVAPVLSCLAWERAGAPVHAHRSLVGALDAAAPLGVVRPFHDYGEEVLALLDAGVGRFGPHEDLVAEIRSRAGSRPPSTVDQLTDRELELLAELPAFRTNEEIGALLSVSVNTVKTHLRSIYRKLGVTSRRGALDEARHRGLL